MMLCSFVGKLTAINGDRDDSSKVTFRVIPDSNPKDLYDTGVKPAQVIIHASAAAVEGLSFGQRVKVSCNLTFGVSQREDPNNPGKTWDNYRSKFVLDKIEKVQ